MSGMRVHSTPIPLLLTVPTRVLHWVLYLAPMSKKQRVTLCQQ